jgi:hypothetical protein
MNEDVSEIDGGDPDTITTVVDIEIVLESGVFAGAYSHDPVVLVLVVANTHWYTLPGSPQAAPQSFFVTQ